MPGARIPPAVLEVLALDNLNFSVAPPRFVKSQSVEGMDMIVDGLIKTEADLAKVVLPDPESDEFYSGAREFVAKYRGIGKALGITTRFGVSSTYLSMGITDFGVKLYENRDFVLRLMDIFIDWACRAIPKINELGFDFMIVPEDLAWKQGPLFSPKMFREALPAADEEGGRKDQDPVDLS